MRVFQKVVYVYPCTHVQGLAGVESHGVDRPKAENIQKDPPTSSLVAGEIAYLYAHILQLTSHCLFCLHHIQVIFIF